MNHVQPTTHEELYSENWGTYYLSRYYFSIQTKWTKNRAGLTKNNHELSPAMQELLQKENLPAIFHEFFHYLHDISTIAGGAVMLNRILMQTIFTSYLDTDTASSESLGTTHKNPDNDTMFVNAWKTNWALEGSLQLEFNMREIEAMVPVSAELHFPAAAAHGTSGHLDIPEITYTGFLNGKPKTTKISLGRYYLYKSLAYEADQIIDSRQRNLDKIEDPFRMTEYTVCRMVAQKIYPAIRQEIMMAAALLALQQTNSGHAFISFIQRIGNAEIKGIQQQETLLEIKEQIKVELNKQQTNYHAQQDVYAGLFTGRHELAIAYSYIAAVNKAMYDLRIENPCFELDWFLAGQYDKLLSAVSICDYLYKFMPDKRRKDSDFDRDFMATILPDQISSALKTLVAFDHYFLSHMGSMPTWRVEAKPKEKHRCPFYTCCHLKDRKVYPELCNTKPWRIYELQHIRDKKYCWYATGVLEAKGESLKN